MQKGREKHLRNWWGSKIIENKQEKRSNCKRTDNV